MTDRDKLRRDAEAGIKLTGPRTVSLLNDLDCAEGLLWQMLFISESARAVIDLRKWRHVHDDVVNVEEKVRAYLAKAQR